LGCVLLWVCLVGPALGDVGNRTNESRQADATEAVHRRLPPLVLPPLVEGQPPLRLQALRGRVHLVNVWASWCAPCRLEHPLLVDLARRRPELAIVGINHKDERGAAQRWLAELGDPFAQIGHDPEGRAGPALRLMGLPETLLVDRQGVVRLKHIGPLTEAAIRDKVEPLLDVL
jgi:cytochrome c biogenesis protein CcmG/thiol:disulfide interchange protein DsbE